MENQWFTASLVPSQTHSDGIYRGGLRIPVSYERSRCVVSSGPLSPHQVGGSEREHSRDNTVSSELKQARSSLGYWIKQPENPGLTILEDP